MFYNLQVLKKRPIRCLFINIWRPQIRNSHPFSLSKNPSSPKVAPNSLFSWSCSPSMKTNLPLTTASSRLSASLEPHCLARRSSPHCSHFHLRFFHFPLVLEILSFFLGVDVHYGRISVWVLVKVKRVSELKRYASGVCARSLLRVLWWSHRCGLRCTWPIACSLFVSVFVFPQSLCLYVL